MKKLIPIMICVSILVMCLANSAIACGYGHKINVCQRNVQLIATDSHFDNASYSNCTIDDYGSYCSQMCDECFRIYIRNTNLHRHKVVHSVCDIGTEYTYCPIYF